MWDFPIICQFLFLQLGWWQGCGVGGWSEGLSLALHELFLIQFHPQFSSGPSLSFIPYLPVLPLVWIFIPWIISLKWGHILEGSASSWHLRAHGPCLSPFRAENSAAVWLLSGTGPLLSVSTCGWLPISSTTPLFPWRPCLIWYRPGATSSTCVVDVVCWVLVLSFLLLCFYGRQWVGES